MSENVRFQCRTWLCLVNCKWLAWQEWGSHNQRNDAGKCFYNIHENQSIPNQFLRYPSFGPPYPLLIKNYVIQTFCIRFVCCQSSRVRWNKVGIKIVLVYQHQHRALPCYSLPRQDTLGLHYPDVVISNTSCNTEPAATVLGSVTGSQGHSTSCVCICALHASFMFSLFYQTSSNTNHHSVASHRGKLAKEPLIFLSTNILHWMVWTEIGSNWLICLQWNNSTSN